MCFKKTWLDLIEFWNTNLNLHITTTWSTLRKLVVQMALWEQCISSYFWQINERLMKGTKHLPPGLFLTMDHCSGPAFYRWKPSALFLQQPLHGGVHVVEYCPPRAFDHSSGSVGHESSLQWNWVLSSLGICHVRKSDVFLRLK